MQTDKLINFLNDSQAISNYNILLTDLNKIIIAKPSYIEETYLSKNLSCNLLELLSSITYSKNQKYLFVDKENILPIFKDDSNSYASEIILPIFNKDKLFGLLIFFSHDKKFLNSNLNYAMTTKFFVEKFLLL